MLAVDSSSLIAFLKGDRGEDVDLIDSALLNNNLVLPAVVLSEIISDPKLPRNLRNIMVQIPVLELVGGWNSFWYRAGELRSKLIDRGLKARLADSLIALSCIDHNVALVTRDSDFKHFKKFGGLKLV